MSDPVRRGELFPPLHSLYQSVECLLDRSKALIHPCQRDGLVLSPAGDLISREAQLDLLAAVIAANSGTVLRPPGTADTLTIDELTEQVDALPAAPEAGEVERLRAELTEMTRRRDEWRKKAEGYDALAAAVRAGTKEAGERNLSRVFMRGGLVEVTARTERAEAERDEWKEAACRNHPNPADFRYWEGRYRYEKARADKYEAEANAADSPALGIAKTMRERFFPELPDWLPLPDAIGLLTQLRQMAAAIPHQAGLGAQGEPVAWRVRQIPAMRGA